MFYHSDLFVCESVPVNFKLLTSPSVWYLVSITLKDKSLTLKSLSN